MRAIIASDLSEASLLTAETIVSCDPGTFEHVTLMHVVELDPYTAGGAIPQVLEFAEEQLVEHAGRLNRQGVPADWRLDRGNAVEMITAAAEELGAGLIAITDRGHGRALGRILGTTAEKVALATTLPVLVERVEERDAAWCRISAGPTFSRPLVAVDLDDALQAIVRAAAALPGAGAARVVHVATGTHDLEHAYGFIADELAAAGLPDTEVAVLEGGDVAGALVDEAAASGATCIVIAPRRHGVIERLFLGSVASSVLARTTLPVVFV